MTMGQVVGLPPLVRDLARLSAAAVTVESAGFTERSKRSSARRSLCDRPGS